MVDCPYFLPSKVEYFQKLCSSSFYRYGEGFEYFGPQTQILRKKQCGRPTQSNAKQYAKAANRKSYILV